MLDDDTPHDHIQQIACELAQRGELKRCRRVVAKILQLDPRMIPFGGPAIFLAYLAECCEADEAFCEAHGLYKKLDLLDDSDAWGAFYEPDAFGHLHPGFLPCLGLAPGSLERRLQRTSGRRAQGLRVLDLVAVVGKAMIQHRIALLLLVVAVVTAVAINRQQ